MKQLMTRTTWLFGALMTLGVAQAGQGVVVSSERLPMKARAEFAREIASAKAARPELFSAVAEFRTRAAELDRRKRGRFAPVGPMLKRLGPDALWPMVELAAFTNPGTDPLSVSARQALQAGLLEAIGDLRDPRMAPLFLSVLNSSTEDFHVLRASANGLGFLGTDGAANQLITLAGAAGPKQLGILAGMGSCRRLPVAEFLAESLAATQDARAADALIGALSDVGNAWAWRTPAVEAKGEEGAVRRVAAQALVNAFVSRVGPLRQAASNALMVVDAPETAALIAQALETTSDVGALNALRALERRLETNPTR